MSVNSKAIIRKGTSVNDVIDHLKRNFGDIQTLNTHYPEFVQFQFKDGTDNRILSAFFNNYGKVDYGIDGVLLSLGCWGGSVDILKGFCVEFGGYLDENDCDDKDFYGINLEKFKDPKDLSEKDVFSLKVLDKVGYEHLSTVLELCEEYKNIKE